MVANLLSEVATKGMEWAYGDSKKDLETPKANSETPTSPTWSISFTSPSTEWFYEGKQYVADQASQTADDAYSRVLGIFSSVYSAGNALPSFPSFGSGCENDEELIFSSPRKYSSFRRSSSNPIGVGNMFQRSYQFNQPSLTAVRNILVNMEHPDVSFQVDWPTRKLVNVTEASEESLDRHVNQPEFSEHSVVDLEENQQLISKRCETASQLAEGTLRALRDIHLDEAVELHEALRFWSIRWENPMISWLEAGPMVWMSSEGYNHKRIGQKVSQIQAVLARRCLVIGELQQHLLRAGWQRGVAQWGVLGQGGQWAAIETVHEKAVAACETPFHLAESITIGSDDGHQIAPVHSKIGVVDTPSVQSIAPHSGYYTSVFVRNKADGEICMDDAALTEWSVDAVMLIREKLFRAANGRVRLPYEENWKDDDNEDLIMPSVKPDGQNRRKLPIWASFTSSSVIFEAPGQDEIYISDVSLMASEICELLNIMEEILGRQRQRRLQHLKPTPFFRRCWYITAFLPPSALYLLYTLAKDDYGLKMINYACAKVANFFRERIRDPVLAIFAEVWKGRESISDRKARLETIDALKKMIRSWLDETYPNMPISERDEIAQSMDISLIEKKKTESMKTIYEINNVVRMSFIEMQFIKKEMMNALYAMDEVMSANDINMNLAAITPALIVLYGVQRSFKFLFYALLKLGKSKEETFASFRNILTDIERLLVMRDSPPTHWTSSKTETQLMGSGGKNENALSADDLGMTMVHIHECRTILWNQRRRFTPHTIRSISEDLAELAGERGAVSVRQQLQIIQRMNRTYPFLKVMGIVSGFKFNHGRY